MQAPIAIQLYTVREKLSQKFEQTLREIAAMGFAGVETAGFARTTTAKEANLYQELGLTVVAAHLPLPLGKEQEKVIEMAVALGCDRLISAYSPPDQYQNIDDILRNCERLNEANAVARANGLSFGVHNHSWEFQPVPGDGRTGYEIWQETLDPEIFFELDTYWIQTAGLDPAKVVREAGARAPLLHLKDGPAVLNEPMVALGDGTVDVPAIIAAGGENTHWLIVELDACATDMMTAVRQSHAYLKQLVSA